MADIFLKVFNLSVQGAVLILVVALLRVLLSK